MHRLSLIIVALLLLVFSPAALAHTKLSDSIPQDGETVEGSITQVKLSFSTDVSDSLQKVHVIDAAGNNVAGSPTTDGSTVTVPITVRVAGTYTVSWRTLGADGHPITGTFAFDLRGDQGAQSDSNTSTNASGELTTPPADAPSGDTPAAQPRPVTTSNYPTRFLGRVSAFSRAMFYVTLLIVVGGAIFASLIAPGWRPRFFRRSAVLLIGASFTSFAVNLALAGEYSIWGVLNPWNFVPYASTPTGRVMLGCAVGSILLLRGYPKLKSATKKSKNGSRVRFATVAIIVGVLPAFGGHAWVSQMPQVRVPADALHLLAASIWFGGIVQLKGVSSASLAKHPAVYPAVVRFATLAFASVIVLVITGTIAALLEIGLNIGELFGSTYGQLVLVKIGLLILTIPLAKVNQQRHVPALSQMSRAASTNLQRYVVFEIILVTAIVIVTSWLVFQTPPRHADMGHNLHASS